MLSVPQLTSSGTVIEGHGPRRPDSQLSLACARDNQSNLHSLWTVRSAARCAGDGAIGKFQPRARSDRPRHLQSGWSGVGRPHQAVSQLPPEAAAVNFKAVPVFRWTGFVRPAQSSPRDS